MTRRSRAVKPGREELSQLEKGPSSFDTTIIPDNDGGFRLLNALERAAEALDQASTERSA